MSTAYADTSAMLTVAFGEPGAVEMAQRINNFDHLASANLLEAEMRSAFAREAQPFDEAILSIFQWIHPDRPLSQELETVLQSGYLRGADLWHMAVALYFFPDQGSITFLTLDNRQREVAAALGFRV